MNKEEKLEVLRQTHKKIEDLKQYNIPVALENIEKLKAKKADPLFIEKQKVRLSKNYKRLENLENKMNKLLQELGEHAQKNDK
ncbi:hypothetical protein SYNTR_1523 [Candidatus Syntrophocurvum alkaliphilum]|uniref:Uncharacterized protein n=1 Tax=Candidatus Syntrophocurvum alkaliphilum TaxID=2293317 RepID=A0A6I6DG83_9FIRM|nr:hypothetical protein [Candidatus Syntrophocurvum alkaliphilum]QGU00117.1 hypothetical protein SYNTR_1523 [Candidatus Syntrophocurvum alkaliphilum]